MADEDGPDADPDETKKIFIEAPRWQWELLQKVRKRHGQQWLALLLLGVEVLLKREQRWDSMYDDIDVPDIVPESDLHGCDRDERDED